MPNRDPSIKHGMSGGSTSSDLSSKKFYMVVSIPKRNGISFAANEYHIFLFFWTPLIYTDVMVDNVWLLALAGASLICYKYLIII